jgi:2-iminobutanoate/2-iminopropanoate deaminase
MIRKAISTTTAPPALGPYSQAIVANGLVFCSGTVGVDPATGSPGDGIEAQTELALRNLDAILTAAGASLSALVKTTIFTPTSMTSPPSTRSTRSSCPIHRQPGQRPPT